MLPTARVAAFAALLAASSCGGEKSAPPIVAPPPAAVASVDVSPAQQTIIAGQSATLTATVRDAAGTVLSGRSVTWLSSAPAIASVSPSGVVSALAGGSAVINAEVEGKSGSASVVVPPVVVSLFIDSIQPRLWVARSAQLAFQVRDPNGRVLSGYTPQWTSGDPTFVKVSSTGMLTGVSPGSALITGTVDGKTAFRVITAVAIPPAVVALQPDVATLPRGTDYALDARAVDIDGSPVLGHAVTFQSSNPSVATVSTQGVVTSVANGSVTITATVDGTQQSTSRITVTDPRTVTGTVVAADGRAFRNLAFIARFGLTASAQRFAAPVDPVTGAFSLVMPSFPAGGPTIEYFVDVATGSARAYHPSYARLSNGAVPRPDRILLIPLVVVPDSGTYAGRTLPVDLNDAFIPVCATTSDVNCQSFWPSYWLGGIKHWADAARPIPLAFDRTTGTIADVDSVALWTAIRSMEADLGRRLFRPAMFTAYTTTGYTVGSVLVSRDASVAPFVGFTNWSWDASGVLYQAKVRLASAQYFANLSTLSHEFTHALGFSHTCRWQTVMGGYGCSQQGRLSATDIAYYHLAEMVRREMRNIAPTWSINEALQGQRVIVLGMSAANAIPTSLRAMLSRSEQPGSDGAP